LLATLFPAVILPDLFPERFVSFTQLTAPIACVSDDPVNPANPTLAEINKKVVGSVFSEKIFSDKVRKGLKFLFDFKGRACDSEIEP